jgi:uncharacterized membrane protein YqgA involved in biofilm formation
MIEENQERYSMGTIINVIAILIGGALGLLFRKGFPERIAQTALQVMGLFSLVIGVSMALQGQELIMILISLAFGAMLGEWMNIEGHLDRLGVWLEKRFNLTQESPAKGFIYTSLLFCVGSMAIVGSITDGLKGDYSILVTKAMMDGIISIPFAANMGIGVLGSAVPVLLYQGGLTLLAWKLQSLFTPTMVRELTSVGGVIVMGIGVNILGLQKIRVGNLIPALPLIILVLYLKLRVWP